VEDWAFQGDLDEGVTIDVGVECGIVFDEIAGRFDGDGLAGAGHGQDYFEGRADDRPNFDLLLFGGKSGRRRGDLIGIEGDVGELEVAAGVAGSVAVKAADGVGEWTMAPGITAPEGSVTVPRIVPALPVCANAALGAQW